MCRITFATSTGSRWTLHYSVARLHFSSDMAHAVVGQPITIRFVDNRTTDNTKTQQ
jgi:hypothetical protein